MNCAFRPTTLRVRSALRLRSSQLSPSSLFQSLPRQYLRFPLSIPYDKAGGSIRQFSTHQEPEERKNAQKQVDDRPWQRENNHSNPDELHMTPPGADKTKGPTNIPNFEPE